MNFFQTALTFFLVTNPIGNTPTILALIKQFSFEKQRSILLREGFFSFLVALFFQYFGDIALSTLHVKDYAMTLCGAVLLLLMAIRMLFPKQASASVKTAQQEPFFVPIATPLLSGPGVLSLIMLIARQENNPLHTSAAICVAWIGVLGVLAIGPYLPKLLGQRGLTALEQIMGMILAMIATGMFVHGLRLFANICSIPLPP